jgi:glucan biosynthesis protein C
MSLFNPAHLWFLLDLIIMSFSYVIIRNEFASTDAELPPVFGILRPVWTPALFAIPSTMLLWGETSPVTEVHDSFLPNAPRILYFSLYFAVGISMFRRITTFCDSLRLPAWHLMISAAGIGGVLMTFHAEVIGTSGLWNRLCFSLSVSVAAWFFLFGVMGIAIQERSRSRNPGMSRFLADASYWIYLVHLPIVGLAQIALMPLDWSPEAKMLSVFTAASAVSFGSYFAFVRYTAIGEYLHGRRTRFKGQGPISPSPPDLARGDS